MIRYIHFSILALIASSVLSTSASSTEVEMRLRGTSQTFTGNLISFDGTVYVLETDIFGEMSFDVSRFECISGACAQPKKTESIAGTSAAEQPPANLSPDRQIELFQGFRDWRNFETFLEWRKNNPN